MQIFTQDQARLYRTARFSDEAHAMQKGLPTVPVRIAFFCEPYNAYHRRNECVFACYVNEDDTTLIGTYFQNAFVDFAS